MSVFVIGVEIESEDEVWDEVMPTVFDCVEECGLSIEVGDVGVGAELDELLHGFDIAVFRG